jgi:hypothetical protein
MRALVVLGSGLPSRSDAALNLEAPATAVLVGPKMGPKIRFQYRYRNDAPRADVSRHLAPDLRKRVPVRRDKASGFGSFRGPGVPTDQKVRGSNPFGRALC